VKTPKAPSAKTPVERRDERLKQLADGKLLYVSIALAKQWNDGFDEVLQHMLFTCLESHEADVAAGKSEEGRFLFQTDGYVATRCSWSYRNWRGREMRQAQFGNSEMPAHSVPGCSGRGTDHLDRMATRMDIRDALAKLSPAQIRWCELLMRGYRKGEAGRMAGGWTPYQTTMQRYEIRNAFAAAGVAP